MPPVSTPPIGNGPATRWRGRRWRPSACILVAGRRAPLVAGRGRWYPGMGRRWFVPHARSDPGGASRPVAVLDVDRRRLRGVALLQRRSPARRRARARAGRRAANGPYRARDGRGGGCAARCQRPAAGAPSFAKGYQPPVSPRSWNRWNSTETGCVGTATPRSASIGATVPPYARAGGPVGNRRAGVQHRAAAQPRRVRPRGLTCAAEGVRSELIPARAGRWPGDSGNAAARSSR